jgi:hypothetical protein
MYVTKQKNSDIETGRDRPAGRREPTFVDLITDPLSPERISQGELRIFPEREIGKLGVALMRSLGCHVPTTECEAAVVEFAAALIGLGWTLAPPCAVPRN